MDNNQSSGNGGGNGAVIAVLVLVVVALAAWFGYKQGVFGDKPENDQPDININLPGTSPAAN